jgi:hypothetical protein
MQVIEARNGAIMRILDRSTNGSLSNARGTEGRGVKSGGSTRISMNNA